MWGRAHLLGTRPHGGISEAALSEANGPGPLKHSKGKGEEGSRVSPSVGRGERGAQQRCAEPAISQGPALKLRGQKVERIKSRAVKTNVGSLSPSPDISKINRHQGHPVSTVAPAFPPHRSAAQWQDSGLQEGGRIW